MSWLCYSAAGAAGAISNLALGINGVGAVDGYSAPTTTRPATPNGVAWPPEGFVPNQNLPATSNRWSFSYPGADFSNATVTMTDLGAWNVFLNPDFPKPQFTLYRILCQDALDDRFGILARFERCLPRALLPRAIGAFKTPGLRDLAHSAPYMHNGQFDMLEDIVRFYQQAADASRARTLRNPPSEFADMAVRAADVAPLAKFLRSLNEDYE